MRRRRAAARSGEWAQHFSNASCFISRLLANRLAGKSISDMTDLVSGEATLNRATVKRRQFTGRHLTGATINLSDN